MKKVTSLLAATAILAPAASFAQGAQATTNVFQNLVTGILNLAPNLMQIAFVFAGLAFIYSLTMFILNPDNKEQGKTVMTWGLGALFIMFSFFGIIKLVQDTIFVGGMGTPTVPTMPTTVAAQN